MSKQALSLTTSQEEAALQAEIAQMRAELAELERRIAQMKRGTPGRLDLKREQRNLKARIYNRTHRVEVAEFHREPIAEGDSPLRRLTWAESDEARLEAPRAPTIADVVLRATSRGYSAYCPKCGGLCLKHQDGLACGVCNRIYYDPRRIRAHPMEN
jgi:hypothetical protein